MGGFPNPGLAWLTTAGGGAWSVTAEAIRRRRLAEGWTKHSAAPGGADACVGCGAHGPPARVFALIEIPGQSVEDLRDAV